MPTPQDLTRAELRFWCEKTLENISLFPPDERATRVLKYLIKDMLADGHGADRETILKEVLGSDLDPTGVSQAIGELRDKLEKYCNGAGADYGIMCTVSSGRNHPYRLEFSRRSGRAQAPASASRPALALARDTLVECFYVGKDHAALEYEIQQLPYLTTLRDTHIRLTKDRHKYDDQLLDKFQQGLREFLARHPDNKLLLIAGPIVEMNYVESVRRAAEGQTHKVQYSRLKQPGPSRPFMNFAILEYADADDQRKEVLFGWGKYDYWPEESVFRSHHSKLVGEFEKLWSALQSQADVVPDITALSDPPKAIDDEATITAWSQDRVYHLLRSAEPGTEVRMLTTLFVDWTVMRPRVIELLEKGVHVKIVMMDPDASELLQARFDRPPDYQRRKPETDLREQLRQFEEICAGQRHKGVLEVRKSRIMPFGFFVQSGNKIVMGLMPPLTAYHEGPMIELRADSSLGQELAKNWLGYWSIRSSAELEELEGQPDVRQVWLYASDLLNDTGKRARFKEVVRENAKRGVRYTLIFSEQRITEEQLREFRGIFPQNSENKRPGLTEVPLADQEFLQLISSLTLTSAQKPPHIVIYNPKRENNKPADLYIEDPKFDSNFLWRKMESDEAEITLNQFVELMKRHS